MRDDAINRGQMLICLLIDAKQPRGCTEVLPEAALLIRHR